MSYYVSTWCPETDDKAEFYVLYQILKSLNKNMEFIK